MDNFRWASTGPCKPEKIRIRRNDYEPLGRCVLPNLLIGRGTRQTRIEDMRGAREEFSEAANQLGREICIEEEFQRDLRSRPV